MNGTGHFLCTAAIVAPISYAVSHGDTATVVGLTFTIGLAALLPDLDHPASTAAGFLRVRALSSLWGAHHRHRSGWTHSLLACLGWPLLIAVVLGLFASFPVRGCLIVAGILAAGGLAHLFEDWIPLGSKSGVPLFAPFSKRQWKLGRRRARVRRMRTELPA